MKLRSAAISLLTMAAVFVAGVMLFNFVVMPLLIHQRGTVIVPDVQNVSEAQAERDLHDVGLNLRVERSENHVEIPSGFVISQSPRANETVKEGRTVEVVLSLGARAQRVPELKGMSLRQGRILLVRNNLKVGRVARVVTLGEPRETVMASRPAEGAELVEGSAVDVVVAVGGRKRRYIMPDLAGQDLLFIKDKLRDMGFRVSGVRYELRDGVYPNTIVGQKPGPGAGIREGDSIELVAARSG